MQLSEQNSKGESAVELSEQNPKNNLLGFGSVSTWQVASAVRVSERKVSDRICSAKGSTIFAAVGLSSELATAEAG